MEKQNIYIVKYAKGSYEDYEEIIIFATMDEIKANNYVRKYNIILDKLKTQYHKYGDHSGGFSTIKKEFIRSNVFYRFYEVFKLRRCFYEEVELR